MTAPVSGMCDLDGQVAVVTGAAGGIGTSTCSALAREGADVVAVDIDREGLSGVASTVETRGRTCETVRCDVSDPAEVDALRAVVQDTFGASEILVNAHGTIDRTALSELTLDGWRRQLAVNLDGTFLVTQALYEKMVDGGYGKIVQLGSLAGTVGGVDCGPHYAASKGAIHAFTKWLAIDGAPHGVYANAIAPGPVRTAMTAGGTYADDMSPLGRLGDPADIAEAVVFLASQQSHWMTGQVLEINGGISMA